MADRYLYIACIGILVPLVDGVFQCVQKYKFNIGLWFCSMVCAVCLYLTFLRNDIWLSEENFWTSIVKTFPNSAIAQSSIGGVYLNDGNFEKALVHIDKALSIDDRNYMAWYNKGLAYFRQGKANLALPALGKAISINQYTKAFFTRAIIFRDLRQYAKCCDDIEKVLQQEPGNARAYYIKGSCMEEQNDLPAALMNYNEAVKHDASEGLFYLRRGIVETKLGQANSALHDLSKVIERAPQNAIAWYWRGVAKYNCGQMPCDDLEHAEKLGSKQAADAIEKICKTY